MTLSPRELGNRQRTDAQQTMSTTLQTIGQGKNIGKTMAEWGRAGLIAISILAYMLGISALGLAVYQAFGAIGIGGFAALAFLAVTPFYSPETWLHYVGIFALIVGASAAAVGVHDGLMLIASLGFWGGLGLFGLVLVVSDYRESIDPTEVTT